MYYFLADIRNPTRHTILLYNLHTEQQFRDAIASLENKKVRYVLWDTVVEDRNMKTWFPTYQSPPPEQHWMEKYLEARYEVTGVKNGFRIMRRKDETSDAAVLKSGRDVPNAGPPSVAKPPSSKHL